MKFKVALLDFDGTLVTKDILDLLCKAVGKEKESEALNAAFHRGELPGVTGLISRINFLNGLTKSQISEILKPESYLMPGTLELMAFFKKNTVTTILASGNIEPVLEYYQKLLGIDYIVGSKPNINGETIEGIDESAFSSRSFKVDGINKILSKLAVTKEDIVALGDSPSDEQMFELAGFSIAVNPKGDIAQFSNQTIENDLNQAVAILEKITHGTR